MKNEVLNCPIWFRKYLVSYQTIHFSNPIIQNIVLANFSFFLRITHKKPHYSVVKTIDQN